MNNKDSQKECLYRVLDNHVSSRIKSRLNNNSLWEYGYNEKYNLVVISKTGQIGDIIDIDGLVIALPKEPDDCYKRSNIKSEQYWKRFNVPDDISKIKSIFQWNDKPLEFKNKWVGYIEEEFNRRDNGFWFMNNGVKTYITGSHYMYLQWAKIDVGYPEYREANRVFYIFWEACKADDRCFGMLYLKIRRSGFSFMGASECVNIGSIARDSKVGILSKTGADAKSLFIEKVVPINNAYPFFFKPIMDGMDKPKMEILYRVPASRITRKNMSDVVTENIEGLNTTINFKNTDNNSYDGDKLLFLLHDESSKWLKPNSILDNWLVTKTCLRIGKKIIGKCMMGSTVNALSKGGDNFKELYEASNVNDRNENGQTKSGMYSLFIPMEFNMEGFIDKYGMPVLKTPPEPVLAADGSKIMKGAIDYWESEVNSLKNDSYMLNEFYRQFPRNISHAFRDESSKSLFNLTKIYQQIDYNTSMLESHIVTRVSFHWKNGEPDTKVIMTPDQRGRFLVSWVPPINMQNNFIIRHGLKYPCNEHLGSFGCDSYDISAVVDGRGSNGSLHGMLKYHMDEAPVNQFFLEYIARPATAEIFFEDVLMACVFYGMPMLAENTKPRLLYHFKNRGYRPFSINRPDKPYNNLSRTEIELGGTPNASEDMKQAHAAAIGTYIEKYIGFDFSGTYRPPDEIGTMPFTRTLEDWAKFDMNNRTKHDASISSGLAIMANQKNIYLPDIKKNKIIINLAKYNNSGMQSQPM